MTSSLNRCLYCFNFQEPFIEQVRSGKNNRKEYEVNLIRIIPEASLLFRMNKLLPATFRIEYDLGALVAGAKVDTAQTMPSYCSNLKHRMQVPIHRSRVSALPAS